MIDFIFFYRFLFFLLVFSQNDDHFIHKNCLLKNVCHSFSIKVFFHIFCIYFLYLFYPIWISAMARRVTASRVPSASVCGWTLQELVALGHANAMTTLCLSPCPISLRAMGNVLVFLLLF